MKKADKLFFKNMIWGAVCMSMGFFAFVPALVIAMFGKVFIWLVFMLLAGVVLCTYGAAKMQNAVYKNYDEEGDD